MFIKIIQFIFTVLSYIPVYIYNLLYSRFYTKYALAYI